MGDFSISIIVPVHAGQDKKVFKASMTALLRADPRPEEVILVSDGRRISLPAGIPDPSGLIQLETGVQSGPSVARNLGAKHATGTILLFIDSDVVVPPDIVALVRREFEREERIDALFGSYDTSPQMPNFLSQYRNLLHHYVHQKGREEAFTFWAGCGAIRREVFLKAGGFDGTRFPHPSIEDIELGYRLRKGGYTIRLCKNIQVKHLKKWEAYSMLKVDFFQRALPWTTLLLKEKGFKNDLNIKISDRLSVGMVFLLIFSLLIAVPYPFLAVLAVPFLLGFLALNYDLYRFYYRQKGWWFTLKVIPWHSTFYLVSGLAFVLGLTNHYLTTKNL